MAYEMTQLILQPTRVTSDTSTTLDMILVYHPGLHKSSGVMKYNFSDHYLVYTDFEFNLINQRGSTHNVVQFRDMKQFNPEKFLNDLNNCEVLNGSLYDEDISLEKWKLKFNKICNKNAPIKVARLEKRSNPWITPDVVELMYKRDHVHAKSVRKKIIYCLTNIDPWGTRLQKLSRKINRSIIIKLIVYVRSTQRKCGLKFEG